MAQVINCNCRNTSNRNRGAGSGSIFRICVEWLSLSMAQAFNYHLMSCQVTRQILLCCT
uniref:Uncharacterized protein n=1 Tax=Arundo donax TaxID=35708 RepID=A0A0A9FT33_ARUDO